jgi:hypothetical protein
MAGEASITRVYEGLLTTTLDNYMESGKLFDNIADATPLLAWLMSGDRVKTVTGGDFLSTGMMHELNTTAKSYSGYEQLDVTPQEGMTRAFLDPKQYSGTVSISGDETTANAGEAEVLDLLQAKTMQTEISLADQLSQGAWSDGTGNSSKDLTGLQAMIDPTPATGTYANINAANNTAWRNQFAATVGAAATNLLSTLRTEYNDCSQGKGAMSTRPDKIFTTQTVHEALEAVLFPMFQFTGSAGESGANAGVTNLAYKAADVDWDADCPSGNLYILDSAHLWLACYRGRKLESAGPLQRPGNQDALLTQILFKGNLVTPARKKLGGMSGIT